MAGEGPAIHMHATHVASDAPPPLANGRRLDTPANAGLKRCTGPAVAMVPTKVPLIYCSQWCITKLRSIIPRPFEGHCQELHFKMYSHLQVPIFSEISAKNDFYHNAAGQRAAILVSPLVCLCSTTLRMNGSHVVTTAAHGTNTLSSRARTDQGRTGRRRAGHRRAAALRGSWHSSAPGEAGRYHK